MSFSGFEPRREKSGYATPAAMTSQLLITHPCEGPTPKRCELTSGQQEKQCRRPSSEKSQCGSGRVTILHPSGATRSCNTSNIQPEPQNATDANSRARAAAATKSFRRPQKASSRPKGPKGPMRPQKTTGGPRRPQEASGKAQEAPKSLKKPQKASRAPKGPRRPQPPHASH